MNTQTQLDWDLNPSHRLTAILTLDPQNTNYANIDTVQSATRHQQIIIAAAFSLPFLIAGFSQMVVSSNPFSPLSCSTFAFSPKICYPAQ